MQAAGESVLKISFFQIFIKIRFLQPSLGKFSPARLLHHCEQSFRMIALTGANKFEIAWVLSRQELHMLLNSSLHFWIHHATPWSPNCRLARLTRRKGAVPAGRRPVKVDLRCGRRGQPDLNYLIGSTHVADDIYQ